MITRFKSGLNQIKTENYLLSKTEIYLRDALAKNQEQKNMKFSLQNFFQIKKLAIVACIVILIFVSSINVYSYCNTPVSYLCLDINPSIELGVNVFGKVVIIDSYNYDGDIVLHKINVKENNVERAIEILMSSIIDNGYISEDGSTVISITSETDNVNIANKLETNAEIGVNKALKENKKTAVIYKNNVSLSMRQEAKPLGITAGKLNLINKLQIIDPTVTVDKYKGINIKDIMKSINDGFDKSNTVNTDVGDANNRDKSSYNQKEEKEEKDKNLNEKVPESNKNKQDKNIQDKNNVINKEKIDLNDEDDYNDEINKKGEGYSDNKKKDEKDVDDENNIKIEYYEDNEDNIEEGEVEESDDTMDGDTEPDRNDDSDDND